MTFVCTAGELQIGSFSLVATLFAIQVGSSLVFLAGLAVVQKWRPRPSPSTSSSSNGNLLLSSLATSFLHREMTPNGAWLIDRASCIMCGLLTYRQYIFDVKLWLLVADKSPSEAASRPESQRDVKWSMRVLDPPQLNRRIAAVNSNAASSASPPSKDRSANLHPQVASLLSLNRLVTVAGFIYVCATIFGSVAYLNLTASNMANDFWWPYYNASREHIYLTRVYIAQMYVRPHEGVVSFDNPIFIDTFNCSISLPTVVTVNMKAPYASIVASTDGTDLKIVVPGLRNMDACLTPWIATQFCWLDFTKQWEMANSAARQARCAKTYAANGAVYLESILRNVEWQQLRSCWGEALDSAVGSPLKLLPGGNVWWRTVQAVETTVTEEIDYWRSSNVTEFAADWQNYKMLGIVDTISIQNALGVVYPITNNYTNWTFNLEAQTSFKMFWPFASLLWAVSTPTTSIYRASLLRQTGSRFAFANRTIESILVENGTLWTSDLTSSAYSIFRRTIGPFGSVDLKHIAVPPSLAKFMLGFRDAANSWRILSEDFGMQYLAILNGPNVGYLPPPWKSFKYTTGGNLLCNDVPAALLSDGPLLFTSVTAACGSSVKETIALSIMMRLFAVIGANLVRSNLTANETTAVCSTLTGVTTAQYTTRFVQMPVQLLLNTSIQPDPTAIPALEPLAQAARDDLYRLGVEMVQYGKTATGNMTLLRHNLFDPAFPTFHYAAWSLVYDWGNAYREVIDFQGDSGSVKVITATQADLTSLVNPLEIPVNVATYIRYICYYVTYVIIIVAALATVYLVLSKGYVEGRNLLEINRVAGLVWVGRTFIFVRSLAAICLLSAESLALVTVNQAWRLTSASNIVTDSWNDPVVRNFKIFIAAGELSWLGFVLNDILMVVTAQYTPAYVFKCNFMIWGLAALLSWASPAKHTATMERDCTMPQVDFQLVCSSGTVAIGSFSRLVSLVGICIGSIVVCYLYERLRHPALPPTRQDSLFLAASAKFVFEPHNWIDDNLYYMDPASAAMNGLLSVHIGDTFYLFDIKIWRCFAVKIPEKTRAQLEKHCKVNLLSAIPLTE
ncbi:unnamed protein product [Aphanomyces euteiches]